MNPSNKVRNVIVTGANKGIGYAIVKGLLPLKFQCHVVLTARNEELGKAALDKIKQSAPPQCGNTVEFQ